MALRTYWVELLQSLGVALLAGLTAVGMGTALASSARLRRPALAWAVAVAALPGALVGEAVLTTYQSVPAVYDHWLLSVIGLLARFGWIGLGVGWLAHSAAARDLIAAARTDGAAESTISWRIALLPNWATLLTGVFVVAALSLSEVAVASLVRVPSLGNIALVLTEKMHRLDDDMIAAISLCLIAAALPGAALLALAARRRR